MKDFKDFVLCDYQSEHLDVHVRASITDGALTLSCYDIGPNVESFLGDYDFEYWYNFTPEETMKLLTAIDGMEEPEKALLKHFEGEKGTVKLTEFCKSRGIKYSYFSFI